MGNLGWLDEQGRVWFCGRKSQRLETAKGPMFTVPCESIFQTHPKVHRAALVGLGARPNQTPAICIEPLDPKDALGERWKALESELRSLARSSDITRPIVHFLPRALSPLMSDTTPESSTKNSPHGRTHYLARGSGRSVLGME